MAALDKIHFFKAALRSPGSVGAIAPSSAALAKRMVRDITLTDDQSVVELGPGTGPITQQIRTILPHDEAYLGIERDGRFVELLGRRFPGLSFVEGSAEHAVDLLDAAGHANVKAIISGLPFASLPAAVQDGIVDTLRTLMQPGTTFRTFQYVHAWPLPAAVRFRKLMNQLFGPGEISRPVMLNVPPAFVLSWQR